MVDEAKLRSLILDGYNIGAREYYNHTQTYILKTFFFFLKKLSQYPPHTAISSTELNAFIEKEVMAQGVRIEKNFNPQGWFAALWTGDPTKKTKYFRKEFTEVLDRVEEHTPYSYGIKVDYYPLIKRIMEELK